MAASWFANTARLALSRVKTGAEARFRAGGLLSLAVLLCCLHSVGQSLPASGSSTVGVTAQSDQDAALDQARSLVRLGKLDEAERAVRKYLTAHANSADGHFLLGSIYFQEVHERA